jgi:ComF family protein
LVNIWSLSAQILGERCALCGAIANGLCDDCRTDLPGVGTACRICALPLPGAPSPDLTCATCQTRPPSFVQTVAALRYAPPTDDLIAALKYREGLELARPLGHCLLEALDDARGALPAWPELIVPVPMPPDRLRQRGFNQAAEIARVIGNAMGIPVARGIAVRPGGAETQRGLSRAARRGNVRGAFVARGPAPPRVAIIDDVMTTGATAEALSRALRAAGASTVQVWVVARTPQPGSGGLNDR